MEGQNYSKLLIGISIPVFCLMILISCLQWWNIHSNISSLKEQNRQEYDKLTQSKSKGNFKIEVKELRGKQVLINAKEIEKINDHINALTDEVHKESNRAESIIDKDLDRLNLYLAVGIGFMTLVGVFVPILVNVLSIQELKDKQKNIVETFETLGPNITSAVKNAEDAIKSSNSALEKSQQIDGLSERIDSIVTITEGLSPKLCNLILQNSIARFFNVSPIVLTNALRKKDFKDFVSLLYAIQNSFKLCEEESSYTIRDNSEFDHTIADFILFLETEQFRFQTIFNSRVKNLEFERLISVLTTLKSSSDVNEKENFEKVRNQLQNVINIIQ